MNSVGEECQELKQSYDACFNVWFSEKFLRGETKDECAPMFKVYQECVKVNEVFFTEGITALLRHLI